MDLTKEPNFILCVITTVKRIFSHHLRMKIIAIIERQQSLNKLTASSKFFHIHTQYIYFKLPLTVQALNSQLKHLQKLVWKAGGKAWFLEKEESYNHP